MIYTQKIDIQHLSGYLRSLGPRGTKAIHRGIVSGAMRSITVVQRSQDAKDANNTGAMRRGWKARSTPDGASIFNEVPIYPSVVEEGRRRGAPFPPPEAIARWAQRRLGLSYKEAKAAAFPIARAVVKRGIKGRYILGSAIPEIGWVVIEEVEKELLAEMVR